MWGIYSLGFGGAGAVDVAGIWRYDSGHVYSLSATQAATLSSLGYASAPDPRALYFFDGRGSGTFDGYGLFDLSLQYSIPVWQSLNPWIKAEVYNLMHKDTPVRWDTSVVPDPDSPLDELGLPTQYLAGGVPASANPRRQTTTRGGSQGGTAFACSRWPCGSVSRGEVVKTSFFWLQDQLRCPLPPAASLKHHRTLPLFGRGAHPSTR